MRKYYLSFNYGAMFNSGDDLIVEIENPEVADRDRFFKVVERCIDIIKERKEKREHEPEAE